MQTNLSPKELLELWLKTLEEHPERQARNRLGVVENGQEKFCCLGQLCDICLGDDTKELVETAEGRELILYAGEQYDLPPDVVGYLGFYGESGEFLKPASVEVGGPVYDSLADMNDCGLTWPQIVQYIRENQENVLKLPEETN